MHDFDLSLLANKYKTKSKTYDHSSSASDTLTLSDVLNEHLDEVGKFSSNTSFNKTEYQNFLRDYLKDGLRIFLSR